MALNTKLLSMDEVGRLLLAAGFTRPNAVIGLSVIWAESGGNAWAVNVNSSPGKATDGSIDLGLCQFNSYWFPLITPAKAFDPPTAVQKFFDVSKGTNFGYWNAFVNQYHVKFLPWAQATIDNIA